MPAETVDLERWVSLVSAAALVSYGLTRRSVAGVCLAAAAVPFAYRSLAGEWPRLPRLLDRVMPRGDTRAALGGGAGIHVRESFRLEVPIAEVYAFWRHLENLPRFMRHIESVVDLGDDRSHWVVRGPAGLWLEWDAEIINDIPNAIIAWRSLPEADVVSAGSVHFDPARNGRSTQVWVHLQYAPPAGRAGALFASLFGREPSQTIREDLRRLKQLLEAGEVPRTSRHT